ncbi:MAG: response regulator transcription factor [Verrucomicrobiota bacterium]
MSDKVKVVIVDDHPLFRDGLRQLIERDPRFEVVAEAGTGEEAVALAQNLKPQVLVLDINLPKLSGLAVAREIQARQLPVHVLIVTMNNDEATFNQAINYDVKGYVLKENASMEIANGLRAVADGQVFITPSMSGYLINRRRRTEALKSSQPGLNELTTAERRILKLISQNKTSKQISSELFISVRTVDAHRANICQKLNLRGMHALLQFAIEHRSEL